MLVNDGDVGKCKFFNNPKGLKVLDYFPKIVGS